MLGRLQAIAEVCLLLGLALVGLCIMAPLFCITQALKGNPFWFHHKYDKTAR